MYDFSRCKLCGKQAGAPKYRLPQTTLYCCASCDFHYIDALDEFPDEQPGEELLTAEARTFIESRLPQNAVQLEKNLQFVQAQVALAGKRCLDIGSGAGLFLSLLQEAGAAAQGIEPQQVFREFAREKFQVDPRRELINDPYWQDGFSGYFDVVTLWDTLEHVNFPAETLRAASRVIRPGGYLFLDTPSRDSRFYRLSEWSYRLSRGGSPLLLNTLYSPRPYRHKQIFTAVQLRRLLEDCGLFIAGRSAFHRSAGKLVVVCRKEMPDSA